MSRSNPEGRTAQRRHHAVLFAALADETRLSLVTTLAAGEPRSIAQLTATSRVTRQAITKHLRILEHAGIVHSHRNGRESRYHFDPGPMHELRAYLDRVSAQWDQLLGRLKLLVEE